MIHALGYVCGPFDATAPGRLCRGRERWIEYESMELEGETPTIHRLVMSGACFSDDSARDARRGLPFAQIPYHSLLTGLMGEGSLIAYCEEGHPRQIPEGALGVEHHTVSRPAGPLRQWVVRWSLPCPDEDTTAQAIEAGADVFVALSANAAGQAQPVIDTPAIPVTADAEEWEPAPYCDALARGLFMLTGFRNPIRPTRLFQPMGIPMVLEYATAVALLHKDKHGPAMGVYTLTEPVIPAQLDAIPTNGHPVLIVPFAIPPMLARWDRALWELRQHWPGEERGEFPVPAARNERRAAQNTAEE